MRAQFPSHLYVRVDRSLRAGLIAAAAAQGITVSTLARSLLQRALNPDVGVVGAPAGHRRPSATGLEG